MPSGNFFVAKLYVLRVWSVLIRMGSRDAFGACRDRV